MKSSGAEFGSDSEVGGVKRPNGVARARLRGDYEDFLYGEAALLDAWNLQEWLALFVEGATYEVPSIGTKTDADPAVSLFYIADDWFRLKHRVARLLKPGAHAEWPRSVTLRQIANVRIIGVEAEDVDIACSFTTYRSRDDITHTFMGQHLYRLREVNGAIRIAAKRTLLKMSSLRPHGRVSIII